MLFRLVLPLGLLIALAGSIPTPEDTAISTSRQARTFNEIIPFFRKMLGGFGFNTYGTQGHSFAQNDDRFGITDLMVPLVMMKFFKDMFGKFAPQTGFSRTAKVLKDDSVYTISELLDDAEESYKNFIAHVNASESQGRSGRTFHDSFDFLKKHNKFNGKIQKKFRALLDGPEADSLAAAGGIAAGIIGSVGLGLLLSHLKLVKSTEVAKARSASLFDDWAIENEIEDRIPLVSTFEAAIASLDTNGRTSRTFQDKFQSAFGKMKEFFSENKLFHKFDKLYRSKAVTPAAVLGGVGAGLIGSLGLGLLASGLTEKSRAGRGRALDTDNNFDAAFDGFDKLVDGFSNELADIAEKNEETQGRQGRTLLTKLKLAYILKKIIENKKNGALKTKLDKFFKDQSPLAVTGGLTAGAIGITGLGLLIAALVKADKPFFEPDYDVSYEPEPPIFNTFNRDDVEVTTAKATPTQAPITDAQVQILRDALIKVSTGSCGQAQLCNELSANISQQVLMANLIAAYDDQLGTYRAVMQGVLSAARRRECIKYVC